MKLGRVFDSMANYCFNWGRLKWTFISLLAICTALTASAIVLGELSTTVSFLLILV